MWRKGGREREGGVEGGRQRERGMEGGREGGREGRREGEERGDGRRGRVSVEGGTGMCLTDIFDQKISVEALPRHLVS